MLDSVTRWEPDRAPPPTQWPHPPLRSAMLRGLAGNCPGCGRTKIFGKYLKVKPQCAQCGAPLGLARADDAPPYFVIFIVGHVIVGSMLIVERNFSPPLWVSLAIWLPLAVAMSMALLQPIKGATIGLMLHLGMFKPDDERDS